MAEQLDISSKHRMVEEGGHTLIVILMMQFLILILTVLFENTAVAQEATRISIDVVINNASSEEDYIDYWYKGMWDRKLLDNISVRVFSGRTVKFIAHGNFKNWQGSSCGNSSENILEFTTSGDCSVVANFGSDSGAGTDTGRRRRR